MEKTLKSKISQYFVPLTSRKYGTLNNIILRAKIKMFQLLSVGLDPVVWNIVEPYSDKADRYRTDPVLQLDAYGIRIHVFFRNLDLVP